eukprot:scaffold249315_cov39-Cyclotella_meneghiniana.AAC.8
MSTIFTMNSQTNRRKRRQNNYSSLMMISSLLLLVRSTTAADTDRSRLLSTIGSTIQSAYNDAPSPAKLHYKRKRHRRLIVGGETAPPGRFPYVVSLQSERVLDSSEVSSYSNNGNNDGDQVLDTPVCGGTLIAPDVVLTAGHCGYDEQRSSTNPNDGSSSSSSSSYVNFGSIPRQIFEGADVGAYDLSSNTAGIDTYDVDNMLFEKLILHPEYTGFGLSNSQSSNVNEGGSGLQHDVMLVKLYGASDNPTVRIHNPNDNENEDNNELKEGDTLTVVGFGDTDPSPGDANTLMATTLRYASVQYVPNDVCENAKGYSNIHTNGYEHYFEYDGSITYDMMCAIGEEREDACQGDSGGGLFKLGNTDTDNDDNPHEYDVQYGIVSWGLQCGDEDFPGVYARIDVHYDWIRDVTCDISDDPPSYMNCPRKPLPPGNVDDPTVNIAIRFRLDDYRSETGWVLESVPDFRNLRYRPFGTYTDRSTVDAYNSFSEPVSVQSGRFYMLSVLDEFADGFCCSVGEGYFRVDYANRNGVSNGISIVDTTPGILWTPHALRRIFYVSPPDMSMPPVYVSIVVTLGLGADPDRLLLVALENTEYEALMLYEIRPFMGLNSYDSSRVGSSGGSSAMVYTKTFTVPVFGSEFHRQRYNVMIVDDNDGSSPKTSCEVYLGAVHPKNLVLSQNGNYGEGNNISRGFVLFKKASGDNDAVGTSYSRSDESSADRLQSILWLLASLMLTALL